MSGRRPTLVQLAAVGLYTAAVGRAAMKKLRGSRTFSEVFLSAIVIFH